jgi:hypothetical protein
MEITTATQVTITMSTLALVASRIPLTELHCTDLTYHFDDSLRALTDSED